MAGNSESGAMVQNNESKDEEEYTVIIDIGESFVKVGFAGEEEPVQIFPTIIGKAKYRHVMQTQGGQQEELYVGNDCMDRRGVLKLSYPISRGNIMDWDSYYQILTHIFYNILRIDPKYANVLYAENCLTPIETKQFIARLFFETYKCKKVYIANSPILALFSAGLTSGIVVESGEGLTWIVPIIEGKIIKHAVQKVPLGGIDVSENLKALLLRSGISLSGTSALREIIREIKEKNCFIALDPEKAAKDRDEIVNYAMPDGETVNINMEVRVRAPEILFHPEILGLQVDSIPQGIITAISRIDRGYWRIMLENIVLTGGNTLFPGIKLRLEEEIRRIIPQLGAIPEIVKKTDTPIPKQEMVNISGHLKIKDTCPKCGEMIDLQSIENTGHCPNCGASINIDDSKITIKNLQSTKFPEVCPKCREKLKEKSEFCPYCGERLKLEIDSESEQLKLKPMEVTPTFDDYNEFDGSEFGENDGSLGESIGPTIKIITPDKREIAIFNGASILGSLNSFKDLFLTYDQFLRDPNLIDIDFSKIL
ncbi:MAG: zinc-ribbon domain-containing protein [Promethearchaeota archaeon]